MNSMVRPRIRVAEDCQGRKGLRQQAATRLCVCESEDVYNNNVVCMCARARMYTITMWFVCC